MHMHTHTHTHSLTHSLTHTCTHTSTHTHARTQTDASFRKWAELYARDEKLFFKDFSAAFSKLIALGCPASVMPTGAAKASSELRRKNAEFREQAMHGSLAKVRTHTDIHSICTHVRTLTRTRTQHTHTHTHTHVARTSLMLTLHSPDENERWWWW